MVVNPKIEELRLKREQSHAGGGPERIKKQHEAGRNTAHERLDILLDPGTLREMDAFVTHRATDFGMAQKNTWATVSSLAGGRSTAVWFTPSRKILRLSVAA